MEGMTNKAKRVFTPEQKFEILKDIERQESVKVGLEKYHLSSSTLRERLFSPINKKTGHSAIEENGEGSANQTGWDLKVGGSYGIQENRGGRI